MREMRGPGGFDIAAWIRQLPRRGWTSAMLRQLPSQFRFEMIAGELLLDDDWPSDEEDDASGAIPVMSSAASDASLSHADAPPLSVREPAMAAPIASRHWTAREVRQLIADNPRKTPRYELVDGELLVTPGPARPHALIVAALLVELASYLDGRGIGVALTSPTDTELEAELILQPDVFVIPVEDARQLDDPTAPWPRLLLAVEVLSKSSARYDRVTKRGKYQRHMPEYWIVDPGARLVERWRSDDVRPEIVTDILEWSPRAGTPPLRLDLPGLFRDALG